MTGKKEKIMGTEKFKIAQNKYDQLITNYWVDESDRIWRFNIDSRHFDSMQIKITHSGKPDHDEWMSCELYDYQNFYKFKAKEGAGQLNISNILNRQIIFEINGKECDLRQGKRITNEE